MRRKNRSRKYPAFIVLCAFCAGICLGRLWAPEQVFAKEEWSGSRERLPVVFYNDKGQKVCVREDATLPLSEQFKLEIPLSDKKEGWEALVEIRLSDSEGNEFSNQVRIRRILLHNEEK